MDITEQLIRDEGLKLRPYRDTVGKLTIGVGRNLDDVGISEAEARVLLASDILHAQRMLEQSYPWYVGLNDARRGALINMTFNMGIAGLATFRQFLVALSSGEYASAARHMLDSKWAEQVGSRAQRLAIQVESGVWQ